jgi:hypothetical protein
MATNPLRKSAIAIEKMNTFVDLPRRRFFRIRARIKKFPITRTTHDMASNSTITVKKLLSGVVTLPFVVNDQFNEEFMVAKLYLPSRLF